MGFYTTELLKLAFAILVVALVLRWAATVIVAILPVLAPAVVLGVGGYAAVRYLRGHDGW